MTDSLLPPSVRRGLVDAAARAVRLRWALKRGERSLDELALWHGADKSSAGHGFADMYEPYVRALRADEVTLVEIGVWRGASLRMWRDYFATGRSYGVDISEDAAAQRGERIEVYVGDQTDEALWAEVLRASGRPHVVIDDGGHLAEQQLGTLALLWPELRPGGIYVIEDTHTSYLANYGMAFRQPGTAVEALKGLVDDLHSGWHDEAVTLSDLEFVHFHRGTCVLKKQGPPRKSALARRLDAVAARKAGAWTG